MNVVTSGSLVANTVAGLVTDENGGILELATFVDPGHSLGQVSAGNDQVRVAGSVYQVWGDVLPKEDPDQSVIPPVHRVVHIADSSGNAVTLEDRIAVIGEGTGEFFNAYFLPSPAPVREGTWATGTLVWGATDIDDVGTMSLDWGDGSPPGSTVLKDDKGSGCDFQKCIRDMSIYQHLYTEEGTYHVVLTTTSRFGTTENVSTIQVIPVIPVVTVFKPSITAGVMYNGPIGGVREESDTDGLPGDDDYTATISWGDGATSPGTVHAGAITATHLYARPGVVLVTVTLTYTPEVGGPLVVHEHGLVTIAT